MLKHYFRDSRGSAMVELALTAPLLILMIIGAAELGRIAYCAIEVDSAARAGAAYAQQNTSTAFGSSTGSPTAAIELAAQNDASDLTLTWNTPPTQACVCETSYTSSATATYSPSAPGSCTSATITACTISNSTETQAVIQYVQVAPQTTVSTIFNYPGLPTSYKLSGFAEMRVLTN